MSLAAPIASPFYTGGGYSMEVPGRFDCAVDGHGYLIDWTKTYTGVTQFTRQSIQLLKPQQDNSQSVAEASLNPEEFARRAAETWDLGAGQVRLDRSDSLPGRFRASKGVDPWTKGQIGLLNDTAKKKDSANTNLFATVAGSRFYFCDSTAIRFSTDLTSWTAATGLPGAAPTGICSDGFNIFSTHSASGVYSSNTGSSVFASYNTTAANGICAFVKNRLVVSNDNTLYNITGTSTQTTILAHSNTAFRWVGAAEGPAFIYAAGFAGDKSLIYKTAIVADGTSLAIASVAGELPDGEIVRSIQGYLGMLLVGTDKGVRLLQLDGSGNVAASSKVIPTTSAVQCFEPQDRFVWYGITNYDSTSTGLGRVDLGTFTIDSLTPAFASDLMATVQGAVLSVVTFLGVRVFTVSGSGVWSEDTSNLVASGTLDSGLVNYGLPDNKVAMVIEVRYDPLDGAVAVGLATNNGSFSTVGMDSTSGDTSLVTSTAQSTGENFEVRLTLTRSATTTTHGPSVHRWTLEANPAPGRGEVFAVPLLLFWELTRDGKPVGYCDVRKEIEFLLGREASGEPVTYQDADGTYTVFLDDHQFLIDSMNDDRSGHNGTFICSFRKPRVRG